MKPKRILSEECNACSTEGRSARLRQLAEQDVTETTPLRLSVAAALAFPDGAMTVSGLRRECARGRLVIERIAGKDYTTLANIDIMRELCRVKRKVSGSGCDPNDGTPKGSIAQLGSSSTGTAISPQGALRAKLQRRKASSRSTSPRNISPSERSVT
jgi:hypothetical protein